MTTTITPLTTTTSPYATDGIRRDANGIAHYENLPASLVDMLRNHAEASPTVEAVVEIDGERLCYGQLWERAARVAGGLRERGLQWGDRVALRYPAGINWVLGFWGTLMAGGVPVAVNIRFTESEIDYVLNDAGVTIDLADDRLPDGEAYVIESHAADDIAALFYTSGTTGNPKGVPTTHTAFLSNAESLTRCAGIERSEGVGFRTLICVPLFHVTGCNSQLITAAYVGGTAVIMPSLDRSRLLQTLASERISLLVAVPAIYALLVNDPALMETDLATLRWVGYGGSPIASSLVRKIQTAFAPARIFNGFGMTETASLISLLPDQDAAQYADSVGYPLPVVDVAIDGTDHGELLVRGPNVLAGYWESASSDSFVDGWLRTGDIVRVDEAGRLYILDRARDMIIRGGENVSSIEVEDVLTDAPGVAEATVIPVPDEVMGEKVGAVLVAGTRDLDVENVINHARTRLADYKVPQYVYVLDTPLPRNAAGKVLKVRLREEICWGKPLR